MMTLTCVFGSPHPPDGSSTHGALHAVQPSQFSQFTAPALELIDASLQLWYRCPQWLQTQAYTDNAPAASGRFAAGYQSCPPEIKSSGTLDNTASLSLMMHQGAHDLHIAMHHESLIGSVSVDPHSAVMVHRVWHLASLPQHLTVTLKLTWETIVEMESLEQSNYDGQTDRGCDWMRSVRHDQTDSGYPDDDPFRDVKALNGLQASVAAFDIFGVSWHSNVHRHLEVVLLLTHEGIVGQGEVEALVCIHSVERRPFVLLVRLPLYALVVWIQELMKHLILLQVSASSSDWTNRILGYDGLRLQSHFQSNALIVILSACSINLSYARAPRLTTPVFIPRHTAQIVLDLDKETSGCVNALRLNVTLPYMDDCVFLYWFDLRYGEPKTFPRPNNLLPEKFEE
ncbi:hypothetical protein DNTS_001467 [Danionella cerebrum]|uniref:Uncharacterized protein n=1 Tax=Danionella cerebrum TaxID=2873325 RepID=A0A553R4G8_9TELE|nr:hypothetical protein DNTS_001467 [Danionella translucida]